MQPSVSIVISVYQRATYLAEAIASALSQELTDVEVIVTEDGRSPQVQSAVDQFTDARLRFIRNDPPLGAAANKLAAWRSARGEYIVNLDDDDLIEPTFLSTLLPHLQNNPQATVAFCDHWIIDEHGTRDQAATDENTHRWGRSQLQTGYIQPFVKAAIVDKSVPMAMGAVFRKSIIDDFRIEAGPSYDTYLAYLASRDGQAAWYSNQRLSSWRVHGNQETGHGGIRMAPANIFLASTFEADARLSDYRTIFNERKRTAEIDYGLHLLRAGRTAEGRDRLCQSLRSKPTKRAFIGWLLTFLPSFLRQRILGRRWKKG